MQNKVNMINHAHCGCVIHVLPVRCLIDHTPVPVPAIIVITVVISAK